MTKRGTEDPFDDVRSDGEGTYDCINVRKKLLSFLTFFPTLLFFPTTKNVIKFLKKKK